MMSEEYFIVNPSDGKSIDIIFRILRKCGYNLAKKGLFHWIPFYPRRAIKKDCETKTVVLVHDNDVNEYTSTFQMYVNKEGNLYVRKIATLPQFEGKGIGGRNLRYMEDFARQKGCSKICLDVYVRSKGAIGFYRHHGFVETGAKQSIRFKELIMEKSLS
jgi:ribosomal protein S18 acetylase RimI-like enzyme